MAKNVDSTKLIEKMIKFIEQKKFIKAKALFGETFNEVDFINALPDSTSYNSIYGHEMFEFISEFRQPNWVGFADKLHPSRYSMFIRYAKNNNIDVITKNPQGHSIFSILLAKMIDSSYSSGEILQLIDQKTFTTEFISPSGSYRIANLIPQNGYLGTEPNNIFNMFVTFLNTSEIKESQSFKELFEQPNRFIQAFMNTSLHDVEKWLAEHSGLFTSQQEQTILSTRLMCSLFSSNELKPELAEKLTTMIEQNRFKPCVNLLADNWKKAINQFNIELEVDSNKYQIMKHIIEKQSVLDISQNVNHGSHTFFEVFLKSNFDRIYRKIEFKKHNRVQALQSILEEITELQKIGVELVTHNYKPEQLDELFHKTLDFKHNDDRYARFSDEIMEVSYDLHIHPELIQRLINYFDKRYALKEELDLAGKEQLIKAEESLNTSWEALIKNTHAVKLNDKLTEGIEVKNKKNKM